jgi:hypothetical protein
VGRSAGIYEDKREGSTVVGEGGVAARTTTAGQGNEAREGAHNNQTTKQKIQAR